MSEIRVVTEDQRKSRLLTPRAESSERRRWQERGSGWDSSEPHPAGPPGWHPHGDYDTYFYVERGKMRMEYGPGGSRFVEAAPGDFVHVPKAVVHRESNPTDEEAATILVRVGSGPPVVNVDGPEPS